MSILRALRHHLAESAAMDRPVRSLPARNMHGITALQVSEYNAGDVVAVRLAHAPEGVVQTQLHGGEVLFFDHPFLPDGAYILFRDPDGAPGPLIASVEFIGGPDDEEDN